VTESARQPVYVFEGFRLDAQRRVLRGTDGEPIPLTPRLFDSLLYFVERAGQLLTKEQLLEDLWPKVIVEEHNLNKTVSELRRVLGEKPGQHRFIVTKPGRGYRFVADVAIESRAALDASAAEPEQSLGKSHNPAPPVKRRALARWSKPALSAIGLSAAAAVFIALQTDFGDGSASAVRSPQPIATAAEKSVAVLPFDDLSADGAQTWLADGLAEQILNSLAQLPELHVTARTSSFQFRDEARDVREIATRLGVANLLEGSVQSVDDKLRVTARLVRAQDGRQLWSNHYEGATDDLFVFQRDVAESVAVALDIVLDESRRTAMFASGTQDVEAFREYQEGWRIYGLVHAGQTQQTLWDANRHFERAMDLDPRFALAAVGRTDAFTHFLVQPPIPFVANSPYSH
jgi:TolB-like protein/DNA-binding winged helix-turn-helix (wHTH) protein